MSVQKPDSASIHTTKTLRQMKAQGEKISMLTAYDYTSARIIDQSGIDMILVGDSAANVIAGHQTTVPISLEEMIFMGKYVVNGTQRAFVVVDMPFGSYQVSPEEAVRNAIRIMKETGASAVKLEGGKTIEPQIRAIVNAGIPVVGHLGLTPQSIHQFGSFGLRAKQEQEYNQLIQDAQLLEELGCFAVVLEKVPSELAQKVTAERQMITIGIGAGAGTDGQVLVTHDALGMIPDFNPKFVRKFTDLHAVMTDAFRAFDTEVKLKTFPNEQESY